MIVLDDLQWADNATLELLPALAGSCARERLLILGAYRNEEIPRGHPLRRLRNDLRRARLLREIVLEPLDDEATTALAARILGHSPSQALVAALTNAPRACHCLSRNSAARWRSRGSELRH